MTFSVLLPFRQFLFLDARSMIVVLAMALSVLSCLAGTGAAIAADSKATPKIYYSIRGLPAPVRRMHREIYRAARSGDLSLMQEVLELNELLPAINESHVKDPVSFWKTESVDGGALSVFAAMSRILEAGYVKRKTGAGSALYVWPYFAETDLKKLGQRQRMQLYRMLPASQALAMTGSGQYRFYSLGIGEDGTWHFFRKN